MTNVELGVSGEVYGLDKPVVEAASNLGASALRIAVLSSHDSKVIPNFRIILDERARGGELGERPFEISGTKRDEPCTRSSVQITSRSGGESDSMNQRAVSAP